MRVEIWRTLPPSELPIPILAQESYLRCKSLDYGWFVSEDFFVPFFVDKKLFFKRLVFTTTPLRRREQASCDYSNLWPGLLACLKESRVADFIFKSQSNVVMTSSPEGAVTVPWGTYEVDIQKTDEALLEACHGKHRNVIRKAIKEGVRVYEEQDVSKVFESVKSTLIRQKVPSYPGLGYFQSLQKGLPNNVIFLAAELNGKVQGTAVIVFDQDRGYYMYGGSIERPYTGSLNYLQFEAMKRLRDHGVKVYDLVGARLKVDPGSKYEGIQNFKVRFGASLREGLAFRYVVSPWKFMLFNWAVKVFMALKGAKYVDPIDQLKG